MTEAIWWREYLVAQSDGDADKIVIKLEEVAAVESVPMMMSRITLKNGSFWKVRADYNVVKEHLRLGGWSVP